jgi:hypothetical protein
MLAKLIRLVTEPVAISLSFHITKEEEKLQRSFACQA